jgi:hypothetical protein
MLAGAVHDVVDDGVALAIVGDCVPGAFTIRQRATTQSRLPPSRWMVPRPPTACTPVPSMVSPWKWSPLKSLLSINRSRVVVATRRDPLRPTSSVRSPRIPSVALNR